MRARQVSLSIRVSTTNQNTRIVRFELRVLKTSGRYLEKQAQKDLILTIFCFAIVLVLFFVSAPILPTQIPLGDYQITFAFVLVPSIIGFWHFQKRYRMIKLGIEGEQRVTHVLTSELSDACCLINDITYINDRGNKQNVDHVVLAPNGIFAIETKNYKGKVSCKGSFWQIPFSYSHTPSSQAKANASWVNKAIRNSRIPGKLKIWVEPIVVFPNPDVELEAVDPEIPVLTLDKIVNSIKSYDNGHAFSSEQLKLIGEGILKHSCQNV